jgi:hypothetical protein
VRVEKKSFVRGVVLSMEKVQLFSIGTRIPGLTLLHRLPPVGIGRGAWTPPDS